MRGRLIHPKRNPMKNLTFLGDTLSALKFACPFPKTAHRRRQRPNTRLPIAAEVSHLENRCLLSGKGIGSAHENAKLQIDPALKPTLIKFDGYLWNSNYRWSSDTGPYSDYQLFSPSNATVGSDGLQLSLANASIDGKPQFAGADVALVAKADGQAFNPGYGTYFFSAKPTNGGTFNAFTQNSLAIFGAFTYENIHGIGTTAQGSNEITNVQPALIAQVKRQTGKVYVTGHDYQGKQAFTIGPNNPTFIKEIRGDKIILSKPALSGSNSALSGPHTLYFTDDSLANRHRELDEIEISRFGNPNESTNAQFALQPTGSDQGGTPANVKRITLNDSGAVSVLMKWTGPRKPVTFSVYYGQYSSESQLKGKTPNIEYKTSDDNKYVPNSQDQAFHFNLWQAFWNFNRNGNSGQASPTAVTITKFQYEPL